MEPDEEISLGMAAWKPYTESKRRKQPSVFAFLDEREMTASRELSSEHNFGIHAASNYDGNNHRSNCQDMTDFKPNGCDLQEESSLPSPVMNADITSPKSWCTKVRLRKAKSCIGVSETSQLEELPGTSTSASLLLSDITADLPLHLRKAALQMSAPDKKLLDKLLRKANREKVADDVKISAELDRKDLEMKKSEKSKINSRGAAEKIADHKKRIEKAHKAKLMLDEELRDCRKADLAVKDARWEQEHARLLKKKGYDLAMRRVKEEEKRRLQEENLQRQELERQFTRDLVFLESMRRTRSPSSPASVGDTGTGNKQDTPEFALTDVERRHMRAQDNFQRHMKRKEWEMVRSRLRGEERKAMQEERVHKMQQDLKEWQTELEAYQKAREERADEGAKVTVLSKSEKARRRRVEREADHAAMKARVEELNDLQKKELESLVSLKRERAETICNERKNVVEESRDAARASRALRDKLKEQMIRSSFDRMAEEAERVARIERMGNKSKNINKNSSSLALG